MAENVGFDALLVALMATSEPSGDQLQVAAVIAAAASAVPVSLFVALLLTHRRGDSAR